MRTLVPAGLILGAGLSLTAGCTQKGTDTASGARNNAPIANAGADVTQPADSQVTLDAHASYDPDGDPITFHWSFEYLPEGSTLDEMEAPFASNNSAEGVSTRFMPDAVGTYVVKLVVRESGGSGSAKAAPLESAPDFVVVTAEDPKNVPVADAGPDQTVQVGDEVTLDGSGSYDPQGRALTYTWTLLDTPTGSTATLASADSAGPEFIADTRGVYIAGLVVNNGLVDSIPDAMIVTVAGANGAPTANAGEDFAAEDCSSIPLDASGSVDPEGDSLTYFWELQSKPSASSTSNGTFSDRNSATPTFYADIAGTYVFSVTVNDGENWSTPDLVTVEVGERSFNTTPAVEAGSDRGEDGGEAECVVSGYSYDCDECEAVVTTLGDDASVSDADGDDIDFSWSVYSGDATISNPTSLSTNVSLSGAYPTTPGACTDTSFTFQLSATDCTGETATDTVTYTVTCCGVKGTK